MLSKILLILCFLLEASVSHSQREPLDSSTMQKLLNSNFRIVEKYKQLPKTIRKSLDSLEGKKFKISSGSYNATDAVVNSQPTRSIVYAAESEYFVVLSYLHGGKGLHQHTIVVEMNNHVRERIFNLNTSFHHNLGEFLTLIQKDDFSIQNYNDW